MNRLRSLSTSSLSKFEAETMLSSSCDVPTDALRLRASYIAALFGSLGCSMLVIDRVWLRVYAKVKIKSVGKL
jgi:hypothetical protein